MRTDRGGAAKRAARRGAARRARGAAGADAPPRRFVHAAAFCLLPRQHALALTAHHHTPSHSPCGLRAHDAIAHTRSHTQVSELIGRFTDGSSERAAPVHALRKALGLIAADCKAAYAR